VSKHAAPAPWRIAEGDVRQQARGEAEERRPWHAPAASGPDHYAYSQRPILLGSSGALGGVIGVVCWAKLFVRDASDAEGLSAVGGGLPELRPV